MGSDGGFSAKDSVLCLTFHGTPPAGIFWIDQRGWGWWAQVEHRDQVVGLQESRREMVVSVSSCGSCMDCSRNTVRLEPIDLMLEQLWDTR